MAIRHLHLVLALRAEVAHGPEVAQEGLKVAQEGLEEEGVEVALAAAPHGR